MLEDNNHRPMCHWILNERMFCLAMRKKNIIERIRVLSVIETVCEKGSSSMFKCRFDSDDDEEEAEDLIPLFIINCLALVQIISNIRIKGGPPSFILAGLRVDCFRWDSVTFCPFTNDIIRIITRRKTKKEFFLIDDDDVWNIVADRYDGDEQYY